MSSSCRSACNSQRWSACDSEAELVRLGLQSVNGTEVVLTKPLGQAKGVVLLFHGCQHSALDWGHASSTCLLCLGRPSISAAPVALMDLVTVCFPVP